MYWSGVDEAERTAMLAGNGCEFYELGKSAA
jgi:hypothetical protein